MAFEYTPPLTYSEFHERLNIYKKKVFREKFNYLFSTDDSENLGESGDLGFTSRPWSTSSWITHAGGNRRSKINFKEMVIVLTFIAGLLAILVGGCPLY